MLIERLKDNQKLLAKQSFIHINNRPSYNNRSDGSKTEEADFQDFINKNSPIKVDEETSPVNLKETDDLEIRRSPEQQKRLL